MRMGLKCRVVEDKTIIEENVVGIVLVENSINHLKIFKSPVNLLSEYEITRISFFVVRSPPQYLN